MSFAVTALDARAQAVDFFVQIRLLLRVQAEFQANKSSRLGAGPRLGLGLLRAISAYLRRAVKAVAITLKVERRGAGKRLKHLRLTAFEGDVREQPLHIALGQWMVAEDEKVPAEQARLIALAADHTGLGLMTLKRSQAVALRVLGL